MPATSLVKFFNKTESNGKKVYWGRAGQDGLPFRGAQPPSFTEEEFESHVVKVADFQNAFFDVDLEVENRLFRAVMEACANGWYRLIHIERFHGGTTKHYVEWVEYWLEDGRRTPYVNNNIMEVNGGSSSNGVSLPVQHG